MTTANHDPYSELLHNSAAAWGLDVIPGRPLSGLSPGNEARGIVGNPYHGKISTVEMHEFTEGQKHSKISLFMFNEQWGFCMDINYSNGGYGYGPFLKFCDPYPTKRLALQAAAKYVADSIDARTECKPMDKRIIAWAKSLAEPKQLSLFVTDRNDRNWSH